MIKSILAIETSCDDTSVAIIRHDGWVEAMVSANQDLVHAVFGGVVPEIASRNHTLTLLPLVEECLNKSQKKWSDIDGIAVTSRPGLLGSLMVGVVTAKTLALTHDIPFIGVNHLEGHLLAPFLEDELYKPKVSLKALIAEEQPYLALAISGGHTQLYDVTAPHQYKILGRTVDDAAGEAFDKLAKMLGLPFPGGVAVDRLSQGGQRDLYAFPRPMIHEHHYNFSFSGLKTSALRLIEKMSKEEVEKNKSNICASYQEAIVDVLISRLDKAQKEYQYENIVLTGGVSANSRLREKTQEWALKNDLTLLVPPLKYCTDNAAMIGLAGILRLNRGERSEQDHAPLASSLPNDFIQEAGAK
jgi:N6-L-threonylcarbamoyladenine synthase